MRRIVKKEESFDTNSNEGVFENFEKIAPASKKANDRPKRPMTAYLLWCNDNRERLKQEGVPGRDLMKALGAAWKNVTDEERQPYVEQANILRENYFAFKEGGIVAPHQQIRYDDDLAIHILFNVFACILIYLFVMGILRLIGFFNWLGSLSTQRVGIRSLFFWSK